MLIVPLKAKVLARNGSSYSPPSLPFVLGLYLIWTCAGLVCATTVSISSYVHQYCCFWKTLFSWGHPSCMTLKNSLPLLPKAKEIDWMKLSCIYKHIHLYKYENMTDMYQLICMCCVVLINTVTHRIVIYIIHILPSFLLSAKVQLYSTNCSIIHWKYQ